MLNIWKQPKARYMLVKSQEAGIKKWKIQEYRHFG
jgi:hypothetical protein